MPFSFLQNKVFRSKNLSLLLPDYLLYYLVLHIKFSSKTRESQLVDIFAYENPTSLNVLSTQPASTGPVLVYQFHNLFSHERLFIFAASLKSSTFSSPKSVQELYTSS